MMRASSSLAGFALALAIGLSLPGSASAGPLPPSWSYQWLPGPAFAGSSGSVYFRYQISGSPNTYGIDFIFPNGPQNEQGPHAILSADFAPWAHVGVADAANFQARYRQPYDLGIALRDGASGQSAVLRFAGEFAGTADFERIRLTNTLDGPSTQTVTLGANDYTVAFGQFGPPTGPLVFDSPNGYAYPGAAGNLGAEVTVTLSATPEPTTLVLAAIGAGFAFGVRRVARRRGFGPAAGALARSASEGRSGQ